jgi:hypothetical protein
VLARLPELLDRGVIREGAPGTCYFYQPVAPVSAPRLDRGRLVRVLLFRLLLVLVPVAFVYFTGR